MNSLIDNIQTFEITSRLAKGTMRNYLFALNDFSTYLAKQMKVKIEEVYLDKVYLLKDSTGIVFKYLPIDSALIDSYFKQLINRGYHVMKTYHCALSSFFSFLEKNYNFRNPMYDIEFKPVDYRPEKKYSRILARPYVIKFFNAILKHSSDLETDLLLFSLLLTTGCRISEILGLQCKNINFDDETFLLENTKNKHQRIVNLRPGMGEIIYRYMTQLDKMKTDYLFSKTPNKQLTQNYINRLLKKYLSLAGLPPINIHAFRHTFATLMADEGTPITIIQQLLGHKSVESTKDYINPHYIRNKNLKLPENQLVLDGLRERLKINNGMETL